MSRTHARAVRFFKDELDFSGVTNAVVITLEPDLADGTVFSDTDATFLEGKAKFGLDFQGLFSTASPNYDAEMFADLTALNRQLGIYTGEAVDGTHGWEGAANPASAPVESNLETAIALHMQWNGTGALLRTTVLEKDTAIANTVTGSARNAGAIGATKEGVAIARMLSAPGGAGSNDCIITIESDNAEGFPSASTRATFTTLDQTSSPTDTPEVKTIAGAVTDDWWRSVVTISGAGSRTFDLLIVFGIRFVAG